MSVIGAATGSVQPTGTSAAAAAIAPAVAHAGGGISASAAQASGVATTDAQRQAAGVLPIEIFNADAIEIAGVHELAGVHGMRVAVTNREITPTEVLRTLDDPVDTSAGDRLEALRTRLLDDLRAGRGDLQAIVEKLDGLSVLIQVTRKQEEKKLFMKKLMKMLLLGILTPQVIAQAKAFGLVAFLKQAIKDMVKSGNVSPNQIAAIAGMMADAGIAMPILDDLVIRHERRIQSVTNAARVARGQEPVATGPTQQAVAGTSLLSAPGTSTTQTA